MICCHTLGGENGSHPSRVRGLKPELGQSSQTVCLSHPSRVRGLKPPPCRYGGGGRLSHPSRVRGLKPAARCQYPRSSRSHPSRVRGLKHWDDATASYPWFVAPLTGAWIETPLSPHGRMSGCCRTPHGCVD